MTMDTLSGRLLEQLNARLETVSNDLRRLGRELALLREARTALSMGVATPAQIKANLAHWGVGS